ncbi:MAG TPA: hypothetical protein VM146_01000 [Steroidobacteraceae bacterium]|nr:hypothetical protein [Steroidobacteraceae bacterium]
MLCVILGAHVLLFSLISVGDHHRRAPGFDETVATLFLLNLANPDETQPSTQPATERRISTHAPLFESTAVPDNTITLPPEAERTAPDWNAEARRVARDAAKRIGEEEKPRPSDHHPAGMRPPAATPSRHKRGDSEHFEGGVIIDWVSGGCYYSNQDAPRPELGQALRLQIPTCNGTSGGPQRGPDSIQSFEEWRKEQANR